MSLPCGGNAGGKAPVKEAPSRVGRPFTTALFDAQGVGAPALPGPLAVLVVLLGATVAPGVEGVNTGLGTLTGQGRSISSGHQTCGLLGAAAFMPGVQLRLWSDPAGLG